MIISCSANRQMEGNMHFGTKDDSRLSSSQVKQKITQDTHVHTHTANQKLIQVLHHKNMECSVGGRWDSRPPSVVDAALKQKHMDAL